MKVFFDEINVSTKSRKELIEISNYIEDHVRKSNIKNGFCLAYALHSTVAIIINEHEIGLMQDIINKIEKDFPKGIGWLHDRVDDNADAHLASTFIGPSRIFPIKDGRLVRGTWQNIFLLELDGPRNRRIVLEALGE
ncbi:MAG: YjbQ family protein [archaeon]|nr:YjbQ family protein [archaeon]MCP8314152.1 YjbQ family protein [archaeon]